MTLREDSRNWRDDVNQKLGGIEQAQVAQGEDIKAILKAIEGNGQPGILGRIEKLERWQSSTSGKSGLVAKMVSAIVGAAIALATAFIKFHRGG